MAKVLTVGCNLQRLSAVNGVLRSNGHYVRGADCRSTMRHLLSLEPFQFIAIIDPLSPEFLEVLRKELNAGRMSPHLVHAEGWPAEELLEFLITGSARRASAA